MFTFFRALTLALLGFGLGACASATVATPTASLPPTADATKEACPRTEPTWAKPAADAAVNDLPAFSYYFINADSTLWASASWAGFTDYRAEAGDAGVKVGWFRPVGATLEIVGQRLDAMAPPLVAHVPCCYPTRFQASGLVFPAAGCWEITAQAAKSALTFVVWIER